MELSDLQSKMGYKFRDENLLIQSLTHPSFMAKAAEEESSNQRLEFLGDAVLDLIISEHLYLTFPDIKEGQLTQYRSTLVKGSILVELAKQLGLSEHLRVNRTGSQESTKALPSSQQDALEALICAIYLDSNFETVRKVVLAWYSDLTEQLGELIAAHNPKGRLQELLQPTLGNNQISYNVINETGAAHDRTFEVELIVGDKTCTIAKGKSKKEAEKRAARKALESFESLDFPDA